MKRSAPLRSCIPVVALVLSAACASRATTTTSTTAAGPLAVIETAARAEAALDTVWPGFRPIARGFIVFEPGAGAWLVTDHAPPEPWTPLSSDVPRLRDRLHHRASDLPGLTGGIRTDYPVGNGRYTAVAYDGDVASTLTTLFHESFHAWQSEAFAPFASQHTTAAALTPGQLAGAELERRILAAALRAHGVEADSLIAAFLAARAARMAELPEEARAAERSLERMEGTAHLVGLEAAAALDGRPDAAGRATAGVLVALESDLAQQFGADPSAQHRWRAYGTGSAMGALLDRLEVEWRPRVQAGDALEAVLRAAAPIAPSQAALESARRRFDYAALLASAEADAAGRTASDDPVADFLAGATHRLVLVIEAEPGTDLGMSFDPGFGGFRTPAPSVTLMDEVVRASMIASGFDLSIAGRPLLLDGSEAPRIRLVVLLPEAPRVDNAAARDLAGPIGRTVRVSGAGTELIVRGEFLHSIDADGGAVTVRVRPE